jgi:murein DD-endopeptidase MepM/ murein hydrolase activator NlpD
MKFILGKKQFTLMIIPGANRQVVRIKLPQSTFVIVPTLISLVLIGFILTVYLMDSNFHTSTHSLQAAHDRQERQLIDEIAAKTAELQKLQNELIVFSDQTDQFKTTLAEIKKLKLVISLMTDASPSKVSSSSTPDGKISPIATNETGDVGGTEVPVTDEDMALLLSSTKTDLSGLVHDITDLLGSLTDSEAKLQEAQHLRNVTPTIWPVNTRSITSGFGIRTDPFTFKPSMHTGVDIDGDTGDPVYATAEGTVVEVGKHYEYGNYVRINHTRGIETQYMHLSKTLVKVGDNVKKGDLIARVGSTGRSTGSHLHYEVIKNNVKINPLPYLLSSRKE